MGPEAAPFNHCWLYFYKKKGDIDLLFIYVSTGTTWVTVVTLLVNDSLTLLLLRVDVMLPVICLQRCPPESFNSCLVKVFDGFVSSDGTKPSVFSSGDIFLLHQVIKNVPSLSFPC